MMTVNDLRVWAKCNDGHTTLAGMNADDFTIDEIVAILQVYTKDVEARDERD